MRRSALLDLSPLLLPLCFIVPACGDVAPADYKGEPLFTITGTLYSELPDPLPAADLMLAWPDGPNGGLETIQRIELAPTFPASFSAEIFQPPPDSAFMPVGATGYTTLGPRVALGGFFLAKHAVPVTSSEMDTSGNGPVLANFDDYGLVYYDSTGEIRVQDDQGNVYYSQQVTEGFHLMHWEQTTCQLGADPQCLADAQQLHDFLNDGPLTHDDIARCTGTMTNPTTEEVPLTAPITLTVKASGTPDPTTLPLCPPSSN